MNTKNIINKIRRLPQSISFRLQFKLRGHLPPVYNCDSQKKTSRRKKALLSYITTPFRLPSDHPNSILFSNNGIARGLVTVLNEFGYSVDVIEYTDTVFRPKCDYQFFIGHLGNNYKSLTDKLPQSIPKLYFATTPHWKVSNEAETQRFDQIEERRGMRLQPDRIISFSEDAAYEIADSIICLGNESACESYSQFAQVQHLNNASYFDEHYTQTPKDFEAGRDNFLFFSGPGNVHKGLDLLLEVFSRAKAHLYICQIIEPEFFDLYRHELTELANIHTLGHVLMRSPQFYDLIDRCNFAILPSCGEGQPGSIVECMHQGLIPIVSRECHIDTKDYGITLPASTIEEIADTVEEMRQQPLKQLKQMSNLTYQAAITDFSEVAFLQNMHTILKPLITEN